MQQLRKWNKEISQEIKIDIRKFNINVIKLTIKEKKSMMIA